VRHAAARPLCRSNGYFHRVFPGGGGACAVPNLADRKWPTLLRWHLALLAECYLVKTLSRRRRTPQIRCRSPQLVALEQAEGRAVAAAVDPVMPMNGRCDRGHPGGGACVSTTNREAIAAARH
jgi:hypothetical protein